MKIIKTVIIKIVLFFVITLNLAGLEYFKGYSSNNKEPSLTTETLMRARFLDNEKENENYFHEAHFEKQGITVFINLVYSNTFIEKNACKLNCIITFDNGERYYINKDFKPGEYNIKSDRFHVKLGRNIFELNGKDYRVLINTEDILMDLNYKIVNPPQVFGDGTVVINKNNYIAFTQPIVGAKINGYMRYKDKFFNLSGCGSVDHDYNSSNPLKVPRKYRSFWFSNEQYSINLHTLIFPDGKQIDRLLIFKDGKLLKSYLNCGLICYDYSVQENSGGFRFPKSYYINYTDDKNDSFKADIKFSRITDKIQVFKELSPALYTVVTKAVGDMWSFRFWTIGNFVLNINGQKEYLKIKGIGNFVDTVKL